MVFELRGEYTSHFNTLLRTANNFSLLPRVGWEVTHDSSLDLLTLISDLHSDPNFPVFVENIPLFVEMYFEFFLLHGFIHLRLPKCLPNSLFVALYRTLLNFANYLVIRIIYKVQQALTRPWSWLPAPRVTRALDDFIDFHGKPKRIRIDNGPEYTSHHMQLWAKEQEIELKFIQPGKPTQNSYVERFNRTYRSEVLDAYLFTSMHEIRTVTETFQHKYNHFRPHGSLNDMAPVEFIEHRKSLTGRPPSKGFKAVTSKGENP